MVDVDPGKAKIRSRISGNVEAAKQFLVVAIGLGLTNSIVEKLKYATDPGPMVNQDNDPFFQFPAFVLFVFGVYAIRFFFNNYMYLHQSYDDHRLDELEAKGEDLRRLVFNSYYDLFLSIFTGVIMSVISMTLTEGGRRLKVLLILLIFHYLIDAIVLGRNVFRRRAEPGYEREFNRVFTWLLSNIVFIMVFILLLILDNLRIDSYPENLLFRAMMVIWLVNSCINLSVTWFMRDKI